MKEHFLLTISTKLLILIMLHWGCSQSEQHRIRIREKFNDGWKFSRGDIENAQSPDYDDSGWRELDLPHDWAIEGPFTQEVCFQGGFLPFPGVGWYRKSFTAKGEGKIVFLEFDGVMKDARIWVNGDYAGGWAYGYSSFSLDIRKYLRPNKDRYYLYQSVWTDEPMIHVLPHWNWEGREGEITPVYCYTNCASAELFVNDKSLGKKEKKTGEYRLKWNEVVYQPGGIKVVGYDKQGRVINPINAKHFMGSAWLS